MNHSTALQRLCRICGNLYKGKSFEVKNYSEELEKVFYCKFGEDDKEIHPEKFCLNCYKRWKNVSKRKTTLDFHVFEWPTHAGNCLVCERAYSLLRGGRKTKTNIGAKGRPTLLKTRWTREQSLDFFSKFSDKTVKILKDDVCSQLNPHLKFAICCVCDDIMTSPIRLMSCNHTFCCQCFLRSVEGHYISDLKCQICSTYFVPGEAVTDEKVVELKNSFSMQEVWSAISLKGRKTES